MLINLDDFAREAGKEQFDDFTDVEQSVITRRANAIEALVSSRYCDISSVATFTEFLPTVNGWQSGDYDLLDINYVNGKVSASLAGRGSQTISLKNTPVLESGLQVWEDSFGYAGQAAGSFTNLLSKGSDYFLDSCESGKSSTGILRRISGQWPTTARSVKVTYVGGIAAMSASDILLVKEVVLMSLLNAFRFSKRANSVDRSGAPIASETIGKYSSTGGGPRSAGGNEFGGFGPLIPDEFGTMIAHLFNWGNVI